MGYTIYIKHNESGEIRSSHHDFEFDEYLWSEGNYACDCNRHVFFYNREVDEMDLICGDTEYSIEGVVSDDGNMTNEMIKFMNP